MGLRIFFQNNEIKSIWYYHKYFKFQLSYYKVFESFINWKEILFSDIHTYLYIYIYMSFLL